MLGYNILDCLQDEHLLVALQHYWWLMRPKVNHPIIWHDKCLNLWIISYFFSLNNTGFIPKKCYAMRLIDRLAIHLLVFFDKFWHKREKSWITTPIAPMVCYSINTGFCWDISTTERLASSSCSRHSFSSSFGWFRTFRRVLWIRYYFN